MAGFTIVNLKEIEDSAGERSPDLEARFARKHLDSSTSASATSATPPATEARWATATGNRKRSTSS